MNKLKEAFTCGGFQTLVTVYKNDVEEYTDAVDRIDKKIDEIRHILERPQPNDKVYLLTSTAANYIKMLEYYKEKLDYSQRMLDKYTFEKERAEAIHKKEND